MALPLLYSLFMNTGTHNRPHTLQRGEATMNMINTFINDETGATALEYGLMAALIGAVIVGAVQTMGNTISTTFNTISSNMTAAS